MHVLGVLNALQSYITCRTSFSSISASAKGRESAPVILGACSASAPVLAADWRACAPYVAVYATQQTSGGHLNPAITLATTLSGHFHWVTAILYIIAQVASRDHRTHFRGVHPVCKELSRVNSKLGEAPRCGVADCGRCCGWSAPGGPGPRCPLWAAARLARLLRPQP